jgi:hemin uptake protein HemP
MLPEPKHKPVRIAGTTQSAQPSTSSPERIAAARLFQGRQEILIEHKGETYRLRITRNDKLILTK